MEYETFKTLREIKSKFSEKNYSLIVQLLLALSFKKAGYHIKSREHEDIDLDVDKNDQRYSIEVKAPYKKKGHPPIKKKDIRAIKEEEKKGRKVLFANLELSLNENWVIADSKNIVADPLLTDLKSHSIKELEKEMNPIFEEVIDTIGKKLLEQEPLRPQIWLKRKLRD